MEIQTHLAAQYLATANKSFVAHKNDDSHTNLGFNIEKRTLTTHPLAPNGTYLAFNYDTFSLEWHSPSDAAVLALDGQQHKAVVQWLEKQAKKDLGKPYTYDLHYELPYPISDDFLFKNNDPKDLERLAELRVLAQQSLEHLVKAYQLDSPIRIWPHHFDTGGYAALPNSNLHLGFGLAIPDSLCNSHYFYLSAYQNNAMVSTNGFVTMRQGTWLNKGFQGAILNAENTVNETVVSFYEEAIAIYIGKYLQ